jgi:broad specificity phosphatase PhoE
MVRHASHPQLGKRLSGRSEIGLSARGIAEAEALADLLERHAIASLHASPRRRALQTVAPLAQRRGLPVLTAPALDEIDFGRFAGRSFAELDLEDDWQQWNAQRATARCPDGETMGEAIARARAYLLALADDASPALCVTHCDIIRGLVADAMGLGSGALLTLTCDPCSITVLEVDQGEVRLGSPDAPA